MSKKAIIELEHIPTGCCNCELLNSSGGLSHCPFKPGYYEYSCEPTEIPVGCRIKIVDDLEIAKKYYGDGYECGVQVGRGDFLYAQSVVNKNAEKIKKYDEIVEKLKLYETDIDSVIAKFEAFAKINHEHIKDIQKDLNENLDNMVNILETKANTK